MSSSTTKDKKISTVWLIIALVVVCCCLATLIIILGYSMVSSSEISLLPDWLFNRTPTSTQQGLTPVAMPTATPSTFNTLSPGQPTSTPAVIESIEPENTPDEVALEGADETLFSLLSEEVPINDPIELAERLGGKEDIPDTLLDLGGPYKIGAKKDFWVTNVDSNRNFQVTAVLRYASMNTYFWIEEGVDFDQDDLTALGETFDHVIIPTNREFFGMEWRPGIDGDPHIYILYAGGLGYSLAGYFSSADEIHPEAHEYSNAHEMFLISSDNVWLWEEYIYGTLAHEFQHMIHWYTDRNEETWLNEGFSMLAELINGYDAGGFDYTYIANPDVRLTDWGTESGQNGPHYGAAFLFTTYLLDRFGEEATQAVVANEENGMESIDLVMADLNIIDPLTGERITANDIFADWAVANFLGDTSLADGRFGYDIYPEAPTASPTTVINTCPIDSLSYDVQQYGVDYVKFNCSGTHTLTFTGTQSVPILSTSPYSGDYFFWSNMGDESDMSLEQTFDLTGVSGPVELSFYTWYDLEEDYDYVFVSASTDGETWQILDTPSCTSEDPSGNSYGCGLNGSSNGWRLESVDLSPFAGEEVTIRIDYITDAAVNGVGIVIDDIRVDAIDYFTDFETDEGGWQGNGFVRVQNILPQTYRVSLITFGDEITVTPVDLDQANQAVIDVTIGGDVDSIVLVISGTTPFTRQKADYQINID
jgi:immune inhibitor A